MVSFQMCANKCFFDYILLFRKVDGLLILFDASKQSVAIQIVGIIIWQCQYILQQQIKDVAIEPISNQTFVVATEGSTYNKHDVQCGTPLATKIFIVAIEGSTYSNHRDSVAIEGPSNAMILKHGNMVYCNNHFRCQCTYCHYLHTWQQVPLATPAMLQQLLLQHPLWLLILWLTTLHGVATTIDCVAIGVFTPKFGRRTRGFEVFQDCANQGIDCIRIDIS